MTGRAGSVPDMRDDADDGVYVGNAGKDAALDGG